MDIKKLQGKEGRNQKIFLKSFPFVNTKTYCDNAIKVISQKKEKEVIVGHVPEPLAKVLYPMMKKWMILSLKAKIDGEKRRAPEGMWVPGGGIEIPCTYKIFAAKINKHKICKIIKSFL